ncbi:kinase-interacting family protein-like isoform X1 [Prosopis cineraria]|uniref:kinase-interacting family protein-like isoform X1 n=2 Tax=Prosopis cineraria TaxID=364024 RepID=UPI002410A46D|nr:kinase-interacting family protein-like isoform X1 [Prosopis cineraria]
MEGASNLVYMQKEEDKVISNSHLSSSAKAFKDCTLVNMPSWFLTHITDLEERMKVLTMGIEDEEVGDTFAERAESYYQKRPQLLTLLQDLYNGYITLSDRYIQTLAKHKHHHHHHSRHSSQVSTIEDGYSDQEEAASGMSQVDSDMESSLSYQQQPTPPQTKFSNTPLIDIDSIVAELVIKNVDYEIMIHEVCVMEKKYGESSRKIDLQKSLLEVLESERLVLLNENASLGFRVKALVEENKGLASESMFVKRKAGELAKCVVKMREDHRVFMLHRKIEDLQAQINGLEKRNKEYYEQLLRRDYNGREDNDSGCLEKKVKNSDGIALEIRLHMQRLSRRFKWKEDIAGKDCELKKVPNLWKKVKNMDFLLCGMNPTCA